MVRARALAVLRLMRALSPVAPVGLLDFRRSAPGQHSRPLLHKPRDSSCRSSPIHERPQILELDKLWVSCVGLPEQLALHGAKNIASAESSSASDRTLAIVTKFHREVFRPRSLENSVDYCCS